MQAFISWFTRPFPFQFFFTRPGWSIGGLCLFIFLFLTVFEPFGFASEEFKIPQTSVALIYSCTPAIVIILHRVALRAYLPFFSKEEQWTVGKELALYVSILITTGLTNTAFSFFLDAHISWRTLPRELWRDMYHTLAIGLLPISVLILVSHYILLRRNIGRSATSTIALKNAQPIRPHSLVTIPSPIKKDQIQVDVSQLVYIKSDGNYLDVVLVSGEKKTIRGSIQIAEDVFRTYPDIFRCHRSYLINLSRIQSVTGNALGYIITFSNNHQIPVSRSKLREFDSRVKQARLGHNPDTKIASEEHQSSRFQQTAN